MYKHKPLGLVALQNQLSENKLGKTNNNWEDLTLFAGNHCFNDYCEVKHTSAQSIESNKIQSSGAVIFFYSLQNLVSERNQLG